MSWLLECLLNDNLAKLLLEKSFHIFIGGHIQVIPIKYYTGKISNPLITPCQAMDLSVV